MSAAERPQNGWASLPRPQAYLPFVHDPDLFGGVSEDVAVRMMAYLYAAPTAAPGEKPLALRPRALALYDPFAKRGVFPAGFRLCCNVYTACAHACGYCYISGYISDPKRPREKASFLRMVDRNLADLTAIALPPMPLHISNSTDALQEGMEARHGHTLHLLHRLADNQELFGTISFLTKNPARLTRPEYLAPLRTLRQACVEVSLICWDDEKRRHVEPGAPSVSSRQEAIQKLRSEGVRVALRVDPLFPRDPLPSRFFDRGTVAEYGAQSPHTWDDLVRLVELARSTGCERIIVSPMKVMCGRFHDKGFRAEWQPLYAAAWGGKPHARGFAYRLPDEYIREHLIGPVATLARGQGIAVVHCMHNLVSTH